MTRVHPLCREELEKASETMRMNDYKKPRPAPVYQPGNQTMLNGKNLKSRRPARKLDAKLHGPLNVIMVMSPTALKLELPSRWWIDNAFHASLIEPVHIASNPIWDSPDRDATVTNEHVLGYDVEGYE